MAETAAPVACTREACLSGKQVLHVPWGQRLDQQPSQCVPLSPALPDVCFLLPTRADDSGPTFGCAVYVGHTAVFQLHWLPILKGESFCNDNNVGLSPSPVPWGSLSQTCWPPSTGKVLWWPHLSVLSLGECMQWSRPRAGSLALRAASLLWRWRWREMGQARRGLRKAGLLAEACVNLWGLTCGLSTGDTALSLPGLLGLGWAGGEDIPPCRGFTSSTDPLPAT